MVYSRHSSSSSMAAEKRHSISSHSSNEDMMCQYTPSSGYTAGSGPGVSGNWSLNSRTPYNGVDSLLIQDQQRRWVAQQDVNIRHRERKSDCRGLHPTSNSFSSAQPNLPISPFIESSQILRSSTYPGSYSRSASVDLNAPMSNWNNWDLEAESPPSLNVPLHRYSGAPSSWNDSLNVDVPPFDPSFNNIMFSSDASHSSTLLAPAGEQTVMNGFTRFTFPHRLSPGPSPSPSPIHHHPVKQSSSNSGSPPFGSRRSSMDRSESGKSCSHCRATSTPLWRRDPSTMKPLCNACGLYLQQRNKLRPQELIDADDDGNTSDESDVNYVGPECSHCHTHHTSVWRRSKAGDQLCNACGVYARLRGKPRPLSLKRNKIRPRSKHSPK